MSLDAVELAKIMMSNEPKARLLDAESELAEQLGSALRWSDSALVVDNPSLTLTSGVQRGFYDDMDSVEYERLLGLIEAVDFLIFQHDVVMTLSEICRRALLAAELCEVSFSEIAMVVGQACHISLKSKRATSSAGRTPEGEMVNEALFSEESDIWEDAAEMDEALASVEDVAEVSDGGQFIQAGLFDRDEGMEYGR